MSRRVFSTHAKFKNFNQRVLREFLKKCPKLEMLSIKVYKYGPDYFGLVQTLIDYCPYLSKLSLSGPMYRDLGASVQLKNLRKLSLEPVDLNDENLSRLLNEMTSLTHLELDGDGGNLTGKSFTMLSIRASLEYLSIKTDLDLIIDSKMMKSFSLLANCKQIIKNIQENSAN
jgi:hypothetical protein